MALPVKTIQELYDIYIAELQSQKPALTDVSEGSMNDILAGSASAAGNELQKMSLEEFRKTFIDTANGPEITNGADELQTLAVDHWGEDFARPAAVQATGNILFSRPTSAYGNCLIPAGTIVKTAVSATGTAQRFETLAAVTITALSIAASVRAIVAGPDGNVQASTVTVIESSLLDSTITVNNAGAFTNGADAQQDSSYRETIRNLIKRVRGATKEAIEAAALTVPGVEVATAIEVEKAVIEYNIATSAILGGAEFFRIPYVTLYIADSNGTASLVLINAVYAKILIYRALGVRIGVQAAQATLFNWVAGITLNVSGPNYAVLSSNPQKIIDSMTLYVNQLGIGDDFIVATAGAAIMAIWGPSGTNDLVAFNTSTPVGDVATSASEKLIAGTISIS